VSGVTLDSGGLIALERGDRRVLALLARTLERRMRVTVPATVLAQVVRQPTTQARVMRLVRHPGTDLVALDGKDATATGVLLGLSGTSDIVDAHVVVCARRSGQVVVTSDGTDIRALDPDLRVVDV
jgi:predicted nucleic acid-binding protein